MYRKLRAVMRLPGWTQSYYLRCLMAVFSWRIFAQKNRAFWGTFHHNRAKLLRRNMCARFVFWKEKTAAYNDRRLFLSSVEAKLDTSMLRRSWENWMMEVVAVYQINRRVRVMEAVRAQQPISTATMLATHVLGHNFRSPLSPDLTCSVASILVSDASSSCVATPPHRSCCRQCRPPKPARRW